MRTKSLLFLIVWSMMLSCTASKQPVQESYGFCSSASDSDPVCKEIQTLLISADASISMEGISQETATAKAIAVAEKKLTDKLKPRLIQSLKSALFTGNSVDSSFQSSYSSALDETLNKDINLKGRVYKIVTEEKERMVHALVGVDAQRYLTLIQSTLENLGVSTGNEGNINSVTQSDQTNWIKKEHYSIVPVYYRTNRKQTGDKKWESYYGVERGEDSYGVSYITIPREHKIGQMEEPSFYNFEDNKKHVTIQKFSLLNKDSFYSELQKAQSVSQKRELFVFVHGFATRFDVAARRVAQMAYDFKFQGTPVIFSWPSQGSTSPLDYTADENNMEWSKSHLKNFLLDLLAHSGAEEIHLIAHSMGSRALSGALKAIHFELGASPAPLFSEVIFFAPDIDTDYFKKDVIPAVKKFSHRITLYASSKDMALELSRKIHGDIPRAGDSGKRILISPEISTIDVSAIDSGLDGHSYYAENRSVLQDLYLLINFGLQPGKRNLLRKKSGSQSYWFIRP